jgi:hypothetical protein
MSVIGSNILAGASGQGGAYNLTNSLRFRSSAQSYLSRTFGAPTDNEKWTYSVWIKRGSLAANRTIMSSNVDGAEYWDMRFNTSDQILIQNRVGSSNLLFANTTAVYRDPSAWYHIVFVFDSNNATAANRNLLYVNGVNVTLSANSGSSDASAWNVNSVQHNIGVSRTANPSGGIWAEYDGYEAEINFIDGQALTPSSFGETSTSTGVWIPKKYTGTYGTNGFYLPFTNTSSTSTLGNDFSGNSNTWTVNNISLTAGSTYDSMTDVPTLTSATAGNYATWNPLDKNSGITTSNGNLDTAATVAYNRLCRTTFGMSSGKWYCEIVLTSGTVGGIVGLVTATASLSVSPGDGAGGWGYVHDGRKVISGSYTLYGASYGLNDVVGLAFDADNGTFTAYKNGATQGTLASGLASDTYFFGTDSYTAQTINLGQRPFAYTPPSGFVALNTFNLPTPTIGATASTLADDNFNIALWTANETNRTIDVGFQPGLVWAKSRSTAWDHTLFDSVRGSGKSIKSNTTGAEATSSTSLTGFVSNGFTLGVNSDGPAINYATGQTFVGWTWKANGAGVSNTDGTITSTVSANTTAGFSIVKASLSSSFSGITLGHGLGVVPVMIIGKPLISGTNWYVYHQNVGATKGLYLNDPSGEITQSGLWNNTSPTSSVFSVGTAAWWTTSTASDYIFYCFSQVAGYSAFGSYTGNGSTDGTFVFTGFRPRFVMWKNITQGSQWILLDTARNTYNVSNAYLEPNTSDAENTANTVFDMLSNGFKLRNSGGTDFNESANTYIYMAFAESPFKYANAR